MVQQGCGLWEQKNSEEISNSQGSAEGRAALETGQVMRYTLYLKSITRTRNRRILRAKQRRSE